MRSAAGNQRHALRSSTGLALTAIGAILLLAVHVHTAFLNLQVTGFILIAVGLTWLWIPVRGKSALLRRLLDRSLVYLDSGSERPDRGTSSLAELLDPAARDS